MSNTNTNETNKQLDTTAACGIVGAMRVTRKPNHSGCLTRRGEGKPWIARWMVRGQIYTKSTRTTNRAEAEKILRKLTQAYVYNETEDQIAMLQAQIKMLEAKIAKPEIAIDGIWDVYEPLVTWGDKTATTKENNERMIRKLEAWMKRHGCRYASDVTIDKARDFLRELENAVGLNTYNNHLAQFKKVWAEIAACEKYAFVGDVFAKCKYLADTQNKGSERKPFTPDEVRAILAKADDDMRLLVTIGLYTGMRKEDCASLKWEDVDLENKRLRVKTGKRGVVVNLNMAPELYTALAEARKTSAGEYVNERNAKAGSGLGERFARLLDKCGIVRNRKDDKGRTHSLKSFHSFRHFTASALYANGMSREQVARVLGDTVAMMETYIDVNFGDTLKSVA